MKYESVQEKEKFARSAYKWFVFAILAFIYLLIYFHRQAPAVLAVDLMKDLDFSGTAVGLLSGACFYPYAFMQLPAGFFSTRWGPRVSLIVFFSMAGFASALFGLSESFEMAVFSRVLVGVGVGVVLVPVLDLLEKWFSQEEFLKMVGFLLAMGGLGVYAGSTPLAYLDALLGWRGSFIVIGAVSLVLVVMVFLFIRDSPEQKTSERNEPLSPENDSKESTGLFQGLKRVLSSGAFWPPALWAFCSVGIFISFGGLWGGPYLMHVYGLTKIQTASVLSMLAAGMILGSPGLAYLAQRKGFSNGIVLTGCGGVLFFLMGVMAFKPSGVPAYFLYLWFFFMSVAGMAAAPLAITSARTLFPGPFAGVATGLCNGFALLGGAIMQPFLGWVLDVSSGDTGQFTVAHYRNAFLAMALVALTAFFSALIIYLREMKNSGGNSLRCVDKQG